MQPRAPLLPSHCSAAFPPPKFPLEMTAKLLQPRCSKRLSIHSVLFLLPLSTKLVYHTAQGIWQRMWYRNLPAARQLLLWQWHRKGKRAVSHPVIFNTFQALAEKQGSTHGLGFELHEKKMSLKDVLSFFPKSITGTVSTEILHKPWDHLLTLYKAAWIWLSVSSDNGSQKEQQF